MKKNNSNLDRRLKSARAARAAELRALGLTFAEIRDELKCKTVSEARNLVGRGKRIKRTISNA